MNATAFGLTLFLATNVLGCASAPKLEDDKIRAWSASLENEYPNQKAVIAHYRKGEYDLYDLAAHHTNSSRTETFKLLTQIFDKPDFNVLLIEPISYSTGESPKWFIEEAKKGRNHDFIAGGESSWAVLLAADKGIPFFGGEPDHSEIYRELKKLNYADADVLGFYFVRQIPQWIREREDRNNLLERKGKPFLAYYCKLFDIHACPTVADAQTWYRQKTGKTLSVDVSTEEVAPLIDGKLFTQKISADVGFIRDHFTLRIIETLLKQYKKVLVVYGAGHFITLRQSFDSAFGLPTFREVD